jgi:hypothetical protein
MMFNSVSACTPDSSVTTGFFSTRPQVLNISPDITVLVNKTVISARPVIIGINNQVDVTVTSPPGYLGYQFYEYYLDGVQQYFAVVNKNNYRPTVKTVDATKKWFNYLPTDFLISFYNDNLYIQRPLGVAHGIIDIQQTHIVLDHVNDAVCFYTSNHTLATRVKLPSGPVEYRKLSYTDPDTGQLITEAIVLCGDKRLYRIIFNNRYFDSDTFNPTVVQVAAQSGLWYEQDTPTGQTYIDARRSYIRSKLNPVVTALDISSSTNNIWIAGYDSVFILNKNFQEINRVILTFETIVSIACLGNDAIVTTRRGKAYYVTASGVTTLIYQTSALGNPCSIDSGTAVTIADPNNQRLLRFNDASGTYTVIETPDMNPAYPRMFDGALWVTGHDSNQALKITGVGNTSVTYSNSVEIERYNFSEKITLVSVIGRSILATHYLQEFVTLDLTDIAKVIPFAVKRKKGPVSHIGTDPVKLKMLGQESIFPVPGPDLTCWINGSYGQMANTGDYFGISFKATGNGVFRRPFIIGETAFDYDVEATSSVLVADYYKINTVTSGISGNVTAELVPQTGNTWIGYTGPLELGFDWNMYGTIYSNISVSTTGAITFGNTTPNLVPGFGNLNVDALYVETEPVYQRLPITNVNPLNVGYRQVATTQPLGVYYTSGTAGNFDYFKVRWVGITSDPYPDGNTAIVTTNITSSTNIPVDDVTVASIGDYVSGNGITVSTRVTGNIKTTAYSANVLTTISNTNTLILDSISGYSLTSVPAYSKVTNVRTGAFTYLLSSTYSRIVDNVNYYILSRISGNVIYINGTINPAVTVPDYRAVLPLTPQANGVYSTRSVNITSITQTVETGNFTVIGLGNSPYGGSVILNVSQSFHDSCYAGRKVYLNSNPTQSFYIISTQVSVYSQGQWTTSPTWIEVEGTWVYAQIGYTGTLSANVIEVTTTDNLAGVAVSPAMILTYWPPTVYGPSGSTTVVAFEKVQIDVIDSSVVRSGAITMQANLVQVAPSVSITNGTTLLFKTELPTPTEHTYEVAFYVGRTFQFLEYYYKNSNHLASVTVGVSSSNSATLSTSTVSGPNNSIVFFSPAKSGNWSYTGPGKIDPVAKIFIPRFPTISNSIPEFGTQARVEFVIDQQIVPTASVLMSTTFGYLTVNGGVYNGDSTIRENDTVSLTVPFNNSLSTVVPLVSIGDYQFAIPMQSISAPSSYIETIIEYPDQQFNDYVAASITIPVSDSYYLPDYYRVSGNAVVVTRSQWGGPEETIGAGVIYDFNAGDVVTVYNVLTPASIYDRREIVLASPSFVVRTVLSTSAGTTFNYLDFGTLIEPYVDNYEYTFSTYLNSPMVTINPEIYITSNLTLTANTAITGNLYIDMYSSNLVVNGVNRGTYVTNVSTGANIAIERKLMHYFQDDVVVYQVKYDTDIGSNVYIPIGTWNIDNKIISGGLKENNQSVELISLQAVETQKAYSILDGLNIQPKFNEPYSLDTWSLTEKFLPYEAYLDTAQITPLSTLSRSTYTLSGHVSGGSNPAAYISIGSISAKKFSRTTYIEAKTIKSMFVGKYSYINTRITATSEAIKYTNIKIGPLVAINSDRYTMIMLGGVIIESDPTPSWLKNKLDSIAQPDDSVLEFNITSDITQGADIEVTASVGEFDHNTTLSLVDDIDWLRETDNNDIHKQLASQNEPALTMFSTGLSFEFDHFNSSYLNEQMEQKTDIVSSYFTARINSDFVTNYTYFDSSFVQADWDKTITSIEIEKFDFENVSAVNYLGTSLSSEFDSLYTILDNLNLVSYNSGPDTVMDPVKLEAQYPGLYTIIGKTVFVNQAVYPASDITVGSFLPVQDIESTYLSNSLLPVQDIEPEYLFDLTPVRSDESEFLVSLSSVRSDETELFVSTNLPVLDYEPEYLVDLPPVLERETEYLVDLPVALDREPEYLVDLPPALYHESEYLVDLPVALDREPEYLVDLPPVLDREPEYLIDLPPVLDRKSELLISLIPIQDFEPEIIIPLEAMLDMDILWTMDPFSDVGAYKTHISMWANQGRGGDLVTSMGTPAYYGPWLNYSKTYNYNYGGKVLMEGEAILETVKYYSAVTTNIATTDYWNYRIMFNNRHFCVPKKGKLFPVAWYMRGG